MAQRDDHALQLQRQARVGVAVARGVVAEAVQLVAHLDAAKRRLGEADDYAGAAACQT